MALPTFVTVAEISESARCTAETVWKAIRSGALKARRPAGTYLITEEDALAWIEGRAHAPAEAPDEPATVAS